MRESAAIGIALLTLVALGAGPAAAQQGAAPGGPGATPEGAEDQGAAEPGGEGQGAEDEGGSEPNQGAEGQGGHAASGTTSGGGTPAQQATPLPPAHDAVALVPPAEPPPSSRLVIPPVLVEQRGHTHTTAVFPLFYDRTSPDDQELLIGPYYRRRSPSLYADVAFPFVWSFRRTDGATTVVPPFYYAHDPHGFSLGLAPLLFMGRSHDSVYTVIPPLLTLSWANSDAAHTFVGPYFRLRDHQDVDWGIFPLLWVTQHASLHRVLSPLYLRFADLDARTTLTIIPPFYHRTAPDSVAWGLVPLLLHSHGPTFTSTTIPPLLFHYSRYGHDVRLITPLFGWFDVDHSQTLVTPLYQRHRGETELDSVAPFFFSYRDPRERASAVVVPPFVYHYQSPAKTQTIVFPFYGYWHERGMYTTWATLLAAHWQSHTEDSAATWIFPTFQISHSPDSHTFNLHPLIYSTSARTYRHLVIAPIYWDFQSYESHSRTTIFFPFFWRFRSGTDVTQIAGNTYYRAGRSHGVPYWEFHFFPFFAYGEPAPGDYWWTVLYGLLGHRKQGTYSRTTVFWIPFEDDPHQQ